MSSSATAAATAAALCGLVGRSWAEGPGLALVPDGDLLTRFAAGGDTAAFEALVRRHGPMVLGVCRRALGHADAEDAVQATFLVLLRKAGQLRRGERLAGWLYGVAHNIARKARARERRRLARERLAGRPEALAEPGAAARDGLLAHLDDELRRLPEIYRLAVVLCELEGRTIQEAAAVAGCPPGTMASRLARGRERLARRLSRHAAPPHTCGGVALGGLLRPEPLPADLLSSTVNHAAGACFPAAVSALAEGALWTMKMQKLTTLGSVLAAVVLCSGAIAVTTRSLPAAVEEEGSGRLGRLVERSGRTPIAGAVAGDAGGDKADKASGKPLEGNGKPKTEKRELKTARVLELRTPCVVEVRPGKAQTVEVTADENLLPVVSTEVKEERLIIGTRGRSYSSRVPVKVVITTPGLTAVMAHAASTLSLDGASGGDFKVEAHSASKVAWKGAVKRLTVKVNGASQVKLSGTAEQLTASCHEASKLGAFDLTTKTATVTAHGASTAQVNATEALTATAAGASTIAYKEGVKGVTKRTSGASSVKASR